MSSKKLTPHPALHYVIRNAKVPRHVIAKKLGIARQTLYDREYMLTAYKTWMLDDLLTATGFSRDKIPAYIHQRALDLEMCESKPTPRIPKNPTADSMKAEDARTTQRREKDARLAEAMKSPKAPPRDLEHLVVRTWEDWPDRVKPLLDPLPPYELVLTPRHYVPYPSSPTGLILRDAAWWFKTSKGICQSKATQEEALKLIEEWRKKDSESLSLDLI